MRGLRHRLFTAAVGAVLSWTPLASANVTVRFNPPSKTVGLGEVFSLDIIADITDAVVGWGLDLTIEDQSIVSLVGSPTIGSDWYSATSLDGDGLAGLTFPDTVAGNGVLLARLTFSADAIGETDLLLGVTPGDLNEGFALSPAGFANMIFIPGHVVVPEPMTLLFAALGALAAVRRRRT